MDSVSTHQTNRQTYPQCLSLRKIQQSWADQQSGSLISSIEELHFMEDNTVSDSIQWSMNE